jgi:Glycosyl hydrolase catalytic core
VRKLVLFGLVCLVCGLAAPSAQPSRGLIVGIYDEGSSLGNATWAFNQYDSLGVEAVRVNLYWGGPGGVASRRRPANAVNPADPAYDWTGYDAFVKNAAEKRIKVVFSIVWTPTWAIAPREKKKKNRAPARMKDLQNFAFAAAKRYSGSFRPEPDGPALPPVRFWLAWNEPNNPVFLFPQFRYARGRHFPVSPGVYAKMCNAIWSGVHLTGLRGEKVACGVTAPRGNNSGAQPRSSLSPIPFLRGMRKAGARFDAYAHHPYYGHRSESPRTRPPLRGTAVTLGNIDVLIKELTRLYGRKRVWLTEYGYQTNPPDRAFGVSFVRQAQYLTQAFAIARAHPRIDMMVWFLVKDERRIGNGWQSGLYTASGRRKPSWQAFRRMRK